MNRLFTPKNCPPEAVDYMRQYTEIAGDTSFPCIFAPKALSDDELLFGSARYEPDQWSDVIALFDAMVESIRRNPDQVCVLWVEGAPIDSLEAESHFARQLMLTLLDASGRWPEGETTDPENPGWIFWYKGVDLFLNFSTPNHVNRHSRNLGSCFTVVTQSRATFDRLPRQGATFRRIIRKRLASYDDVPLSPLLSTHGDQPELPQFFLGDNNECPYHLVNRDDIDQVRVDD